MLKKGILHRFLHYLWTDFANILIIIVISYTLHTVTDNIIIYI